MNGAEYASATLSDQVLYEQREYMTNLILDALTSEVSRGRMLRLSNETAREYMEWMLKMLNEPLACGLDAPLTRERRYKLRRLLVRLSELSKTLPGSLFIHDVVSTSPHSVAGGSYADIFLAEHKGVKVALKRLRMFKTSGDSETSKSIAAFYRESMIWQRLKHQYILPFLGVLDQSTFAPYLCMVSPWMEYGNINNCMKQLERNGHPVPLKDWTSQILLGLLYLHNEQVVHGDLRGANILVRHDLIIQLSDFGLSRFGDPSSMTNGSHAGGTARWMAPEVVHGSQPEFDSDVYSFACVWIELHTRRPPFPEIQGHIAVLTKVFQGARPDWPESSLKDSKMISKLRALPTWKTICRCLDVDRTRRPRIVELVPMASDTLWIRNSFTDPAHESSGSSDDFGMSSVFKPKTRARNSTISVLSFHTRSTRFSDQSINESRNRTSDPAPPLPTTLANPNRSSALSKRSSVSIGQFSMISSAASSFARFSDLSGSYSHLSLSAGVHSSGPSSRRVTQEIPPVLIAASPKHESGSSYEDLGSSMVDIPPPVTPTSALHGQAY
ncbi:hypothetical protein QCA50_017987 [Cerrena zonata]|uniref:Protein kinase domain-containing protein n=1 Tax=Cerrena zonata TaxID=2478898 RepID=A0AAW0FC25_9APHY